MISEAGETPGLVLHWERAYNFLLRLVQRRAGREFRNQVLWLADIKKDEAVLNLGCGTGILAIEAKRAMGSAGRVAGVDASERMIFRAKAKAAKAGVAIDFERTSGQKLPFADGSFDLVISTAAVECDPTTRLPACFAEIARVLKPGGRLLRVGFGGSLEPNQSPFEHRDVQKQFDPGLESHRISEASLIRTASSSTGFYDLHYVLARKSVRQRVNSKGGVGFRVTALTSAPPPGRGLGTDASRSAALGG